ncbi:MAG: response regulator transcription factor [Candidatus Marinimicrobia bacterium]|nr:response regulator transcription factor [Candidatus Neomarinimicrobiota bacterium]MCF7828811.1 response regulator transcription factor [Candidatus Neomarinimicrobiota bacterium]MCF7880728.1 response regulator transcription factor [Candidatus Neomarinimicrobiota bacterium]
MKQIIESSAEFQVTGEAEYGNEVLELLEESTYDLVILDISLPDRSGLDILKQIESLYPDLPVLVLSIHPEELYARRALNAGASGYLTKRSAPDELVKAIRNIAAGRKYITSSMAETLVTWMNEENMPLHETLSDREYQVLEYIGKGYSLNKIAKQLNLSANTVSTYRSRILEKMGLQNNAELIYYAVQHGLVE